MYIIIKDAIIMCISYYCLSNTVRVLLFSESLTLTNENKHSKEKLIKSDRVDMAVNNEHDIYSVFTNKFNTKLKLRFNVF